MTTLHLLEDQHHAVEVPDLPSLVVTLRPIRSPKTALDAQWSVEEGSGKTNGLTTSHTAAARSGIKLTRSIAAPDRQDQWHGGPDGTTWTAPGDAAPTGFRASLDLRTVRADTSSAATGAAPAVLLRPDQVPGM